MCIAKRWSAIYLSIIQSHKSSSSLLLSSINFNWNIATDGIDYGNTLHVTYPQKRPDQPWSVRSAKPGINEWMSEEREKPLVWADHFENRVLIPKVMLPVLIWPYLVFVPIAIYYQYALFCSIYQLCDSRWRLCIHQIPDSSDAHIHLTPFIRVNYSNNHFFFIILISVSFIFPVSQSFTATYDIFIITVHTFIWQFLMILFIQIIRSRRSKEYLLETTIV